MKKIDIIGRGNVATHLAKAFEGKAETRLINPHTLSGINRNADLILISVVDSAIRDVLEALSKDKEVNSIVAHTSGSTGMDVFKGLPLKEYGVFYPLQTFSKKKSLNYADIPFFIEGSTIDAAKMLKEYAGMISKRVIYADSNKRKRLHIAAVLACNFVNHLWALSDKYLADEQLDFKDLLPLIEETVEKVKTMPPHLSQTGPAIRGDEGIIKDHIHRLKDYPRIKEIYSILSNSIQEL